MVEAKRRLAAILSADVAGYSRLMSEDDRATLDALKALRATMQRHIAAHEGRVVNTPGDALLAEFPSAVEAVQAAVDMQSDLARQNADRAEGQRMPWGALTSRCPSMTRPLRRFGRRLP